MGSFAARFAALDDQNAHALLAQFNRERQPDDARTDDDDVGRLHVGVASGQWLVASKR